MMKTILSLALLLMTTSVSFGLDIEGFTPDKVAPYKTIGDVELKLHIFNPDGHSPSAKRPAIVFFFGGGWVGGNPSQFFPHCKYLSSRGMVAVSAEYRVKNKHKTTPRECVEDGKSTVRWLKHNADSLGIDPNRIAAGGGSAGGHVAAATAMVKGFEKADEDKSISCRPNALVLFNPVYDNGPGGYGHTRVKDYWERISPMHNISRTTPPTIVFLGTKDKLIPVATAEKYKKLMVEKGRRCDLHLYEGKGHGFFNYRGDMKDFYQTVLETDKFLTSLGYLKGPPTLKEPPAQKATPAKIKPKRQ
jgi:acetyl esterase/lipase